MTRDIAYYKWSHLIIIINGAFIFKFNFTMENGQSEVHVNYFLLYLVVYDLIIISM